MGETDNQKANIKKQKIKTRKQAHLAIFDLPMAICHFSGHYRLLDF
jgi:hypothetical protein